MVKQAPDLLYAQYPIELMHTVMITHISEYVVKDNVENTQKYFKYKCLLRFWNQFHDMDIFLHNNVIIIYAFVHNYVYDYYINIQYV